MFEGFRKFFNDASSAAENILASNKDATNVQVISDAIESAVNKRISESPMLNVRMHGLCTEENMALRTKVNNPEKYTLTNEEEKSWNDLVNQANGKELGSLEKSASLLFHRNGDIAPLRVASVAGLGALGVGAVGVGAYKAVDALSD